MDNLEILKNRKGATKLKDIPAEVLSLLDTGVLESANLIEWLAISHQHLLKVVCKELEVEALYPHLKACILQLKKPTAMQCYQHLSPIIVEFLATVSKTKAQKIRQNFSKHQSDTVRGYAAYLIAQNKDWTLAEKIEAIQPLAADKHFGVRELAWLALRPYLAAELALSIQKLSVWALSKDENIRRFAVESLRPRGVWCQHIAALKEKPELALPILNVLCQDPARYVQLSVGNWLNDSAKSSPAFVRELCAQWLRESSSPHTIRIVDRGLRTIKDKN